MAVPVTLLSVGAGTWHSLHPLPLLWDPGCSMYHWTKAVSSPIPHQTKLLVLCWHYSEPGGCCWAGGVVQGPVGLVAGAPLRKSPAQPCRKHDLSWGQCTG